MPLRRQVLLQLHFFLLKFILTEIEGSDSESRRKCSRDLLRAMCRQFEAQTTAICSEHITSMLGEFASDNNKWTAKDTAVSEKGTSRTFSNFRHVGLSGFRTFNPNIFVSCFLYLRQLAASIAYSLLTWSA